MRPPRVFLFCMLLYAGSARAIITGDNAQAETDPFALTGFDWNYVYSYKGASAVAVDSHWILTAGHVGGGSDLVIGSTTYVHQESISHPTADLTLVRFDQALPGYYGLYAGSVYVGNPVLMVGFGNTGTVAAASFTDSGSGQGTRRWGSNSIDAGGWAGDTYVFGADFTTNGTVYEAGVGDKDSGGGSFIYDNGEWKLVGINIARGPQTPPYTASYMAAMPIYESWVAGVIPEPSTAMSVVLVIAIFGVVKRMGYMYR